MASTESSRSSTAGSPDSYIGSLISLTSKSEIRYEGVLFNINTEESSIGLRNVRSFGTEGRKKDGPQVPASDKIYEYILFRGSDIKDLQVKSSPPVVTPAPVHNDPAIIQSHYPQSAIASTGLPSSGTGSMQDPGSQTSSVGLAGPTYVGSLPLYRPGASLGPWGSSTATAANGGLSMPMYWQGYYGSTYGLPPQQQPLLRPPPGLSMPPTMMHSMQYPAMNVSLPTAASNMPASQLSENIPPLLPPFGTGPLNLQSSVLPMQSSTVLSDSSASLNPDSASASTLPTAAPSTSLPLVSPLSSALDKSAVMLSLSDKPKTVSDPTMPVKGMSDSASSNMGTTTAILNDGMLPSLITPGQLLQSGVVTASSSISSHIAQKDVEVVHDSSKESTSAPATAPISAKAPPPVSARVPLPVSAQASPPLLAHAPPQPLKTGQEPILPSPSPADQKISRSATRFTEEFDFMAMNEKFNKDEVWGHLGKSSRAPEDADDLQNEDGIGSSKVEAKPVYVKDDFFDSLSCDSLDGGSRDGRARFSEQMKRDTETFGDFPRHRGGGRGGGRFHGGRARGSYYGRGYYGGGRGRGYGMANRTT
ncbi:protein decapping 5-like isoform X2 [Durio zibethinus]|uniref:Protein decapping 5-like isoform X2 n=1 Tax=Durio zibethinus TaxID=66656 RepID=A0A6P6A2J7_DURZI|nr:protein decapping 5-like isoform X2 [Durio zibethinus]